LVDDVRGREPSAGLQVIERGQKKTNKLHVQSQRIPVGR
jgi:hypothetical protein